jgi:hypothetical protein
LIDNWRCVEQVGDKNGIGQKGQDYLPGDSVPLVLDGTRVALIPVADCLP